MRHNRYAQGVRLPAQGTVVEEASECRGNEWAKISAPFCRVVSDTVCLLEIDFRGCR
ncbi:MAG: hypothetical protein GF401_10255 [Chitinivibrionales bacterium]|nr:hypothetical protein [Chitinivibrionales bacterium]